MKTPWKSRGLQAAPPPPPPPPPPHGPHGHVPPHIEILEGLEAVSQQLSEIQAAIDEMRGDGSAAAPVR